MWEPDWLELLPDLKSELQTPATHNHNGTMTFPFVGVKQGMLEIQMEYQEQIVLRPLNIQRGGHSSPWTALFMTGKFQTGLHWSIQVGWCLGPHTQASMMMVPMQQNYISPAQPSKSLYDMLQTAGAR
jgi:hypothetical protein